MGSYDGRSDCCLYASGRYAIGAVAISPFVIEYAGNCFRLVALSVTFGRALSRDRSAVALEYRQSWKAALSISIRHQQLTSSSGMQCASLL